MNWMYKNWWKYLALLIYLYVLIGGLSVPLNSGLTDIDVPQPPSLGQEVSYIVTGYNTNFMSEDNSAWLKVGEEHFSKANAVTAINNNQVKVSFNIPTQKIGEGKSVSPTLVIYNKIDGAALLPRAFSIMQNQSNEASASLDWSNSFGQNLTQPEGIRFPYRSILNETIRNTFFHVAFWLAMTCIFFAASFKAVMYLRTKDMHHDRMSAALVKVGIFFGIIGTVTGAIWARFTWGTWWTSDVKLNMAMTSMLIYFAYLILRSSNTDFDKRAKFSSAYAIFAFAALIPLIFVIPRLTDSLHPGNGGNPALGGEDLDNTLRLFFYPSIISLIMIGAWLASLIYRYEKIKETVYTEN